jgi:hypothetical protein
VKLILAVSDEPDSTDAGTTESGTKSRRQGRTDGCQGVRRGGD